MAGAFGPPLAPLLARADDGTLAQVVALVDGLASRGAADGLIAGHRARLARMRPIRPLRFARLMVTPLDPLIVDDGDGTSGRPELPRRAIAPLAAIVLHALGREAHAVEREFAAHGTGPDLVDRLGGVIWPAAAQVLATALCPPDWAASGCPSAAFGPVRDAVVGVLAQAEGLRAAARAGRTVDRATLDALVDAAGRLAPPARASVLTVLFRTIERADLLIDCVASACCGPREVAMVADLIDDALGHAAGCLPGDGAFAAGPADIRRIASLLDGVRRAAPVPAVIERAAGLRARLDAACREHVARMAEHDIIAPLRDAARSGDPSALLTGGAAFEQRARELRRFAIAARRLGGEDDYAARFAATAQAIAEAAGSHAVIAPVMAARLIEILAGPDIAAAYLAAAAA